MRVRRIAVAVAVGATCLAVNALPSVAQDGPPSVELDRQSAKAGETVLVRGTGWEGTELVYVELCGNGGRSGSRNCDQGRATLTGVNADGTFGAIVIVGHPPVPCPCVIRATSQSSPSVATADLAVQDVPVVALEDQAVTELVDRSIEITHARLTGGSSLASWFGAGAERTLHLTVENTGEVAVHDPPVAIAVGKGSTPSRVVSSPDVGTIEPGESATVEVPIALDTLAIGEHGAVVRISGFAEPVQARATTTTYPWGLIAVAVIVLQILLLRLRNRARRRFARAAQVEPERVDDELDEVIDLDEPAAVVDLDDPVEAFAGHPGSPEASATPTMSADALGVTHEPSVPVRDHVEALAVVDLRDDQDADVHEPAWPPLTETDHLPNPFEWDPHHRLGVTADRAQRQNTLTLRPSAEEQRRRSEALVAAAHAESESIVAAATLRADAILSNAAERELEALHLLDQARAEAQQLLERTAAEADALLADAEVKRQAAREEAQATAAEAQALVARAGALAHSQVGADAEVSQDAVDVADEPRVPLDAARTSPEPAHRTLSFDAAIGRAVHSALQN